MTTTITESTAPSSWRAWCYLVRLGFRRQARAHLMIWMALGLLGLTLVIIGFATQTGSWSMARWTPKGSKNTYGQQLDNLDATGMLPWQPPASAVNPMALAAYRAALCEGSGFYVFSQNIVFALFTTFLLPMWSISFATEGLGREREDQNLLWVLMRPLSRRAIFLAKYVALLPWCLLLNLGGFTAICLAGGRHGRLALEAYWPAVFWGTLAFSALFHLMGACLRRAAVLALLYAFFLETIVGNLPGHFKRLSISFYTQCMMMESTQPFGVRIERSQSYLPVSGTTAWLVLAGITVLCLVVGAVVFTRNEYLDVN